MKKIIAVFILFLMIILPLTSQATSQEKENKQYETITWEAVEKSKKYEVDVEKLNEKGKWVHVLSKQTKKTSIEVLLEPGSYRVSISTFNILGKKTATEWTNFYILNENTPYLFNNYFDRTNDYKIPILYVNFKNTDLSTMTGSKRFIGEEVKNSENTFFIKGKNIFFPTTTFYLVPSTKALDGGKEYTPFYTTRKEVQLKVEKRDTSKNGVYVSYNKEDLFSGYYSLEARNGDSVVSLGILVFADRPLEFVPEGFEQDTRYKVNAITLSETNETQFSIIGRGFIPDTRFSLVPTDTAGIEYPYAATQGRDIVPVNLIKKTAVDGEGRLKLDFTCRTSDLKTGYYFIQADNGKDDSARSLILVKVPLVQESDIEIEKISSKYNKRTKNVDITLQGKNLDEVKQFKLVSEYSSEIEGNSIIPLNISKSILRGAKEVISVAAEDIGFGYFALMTDTYSGTSATYVSMDKHYKIKKVSISEEKADEIFLRPENDAEKIDFNTEIQERITFVDGKTEVKMKMPVLFPYMRYTASSTKDRLNKPGLDVDLRVETDIVNLSWLYLDAGIKINPHINPDDKKKNSIELAPEFNVRFSIPWTNFTPYIGAGVGINFIDPIYGYDLFGLTDCTPTLPQSKGFLNATDIYFSGQIGATVLQFYDIRYNIELHNFLSSDRENYFKNMVTFGVRIPIRRTYFARDVISQGAVITKEGEVHAADYQNLINIYSLEFDKGVTEVNGFVNYLSLEALCFSDTVKTIGPAAFKNCNNLSSVNFGVSNLNKICSEAFANDNKIKEIRIPLSVKTIEKDAFAGWTNGQVIKLTWNKNDKTERDLTGLKDTNALILYANGEVFEKNHPYNSPFEKIENWPQNQALFYFRNKISNDNVYKLAIEFKGTQYFDKNEMNSFDDEILHYLENGNEIDFKVLGDGNKYLLHIQTEDNAIYEYEFGTKTTKVTAISIPYSSFKRVSETGSKKFKSQKIVYAYLVPVSYNQNGSNAYFFDFEVKK